MLLLFFPLSLLLSRRLFCRNNNQTRYSTNSSNALQLPRSIPQITLRPHDKSLESLFYCLHCLVSQLIPIKPNRRNHNLTLLPQDDSSLIQQLWAHRLKMPEHLFRDLIDFKEVSKFSNRSGKKFFSASQIRSKAPIQTLFTVTVD